MQALADKRRLPPRMKALPASAGLDDRAPIVGAAHPLLAETGAAGGG